MNSTRILILFAIFLIPNISVGCEFFFESQKLKEFLDILTQISAGPRDWKTFSATDRAIAITDAKKNPTCVVIFQNGRVLARIKTSLPILQSPAYDLEKILSTLPSNLTSEQREAFRNQIIEKFSIPLSWSFVDPNVISKQKIPIELIRLLLESQNYSAIAVSIHEIESNLTFLVETLSHEAFHHFYQGYEYPIGDKRIHWPEWTVESAEVADTAAKCYRGTKEIETLHNSERKTLIASAVAFLNKKETDGKKLYLEFLGFRRSRYNSLSQVTVKNRASTGFVSCPYAEATLELIEGSAQFVGKYAAIRAGILSESQLIPNIANYQSPESWYLTGALQFFIAKTVLDVPAFNFMLAQVETSSDFLHGVSFYLERNLGL